MELKLKEQKKTDFYKKLKKYRALYGIMAIIIAYYIVFHYIPIIMGILMSFKNVKVGSSILSSKWVGLENYIYIIQDPDILNVVKNTLEISLLRLLFGFLPPIILAICIFDLISPIYRRMSQTIVYIPHFFSWVIVYGIVYAFFSGNGLINNIIASFGGKRIDFLTSSRWFRPLLIGSQIWKEVGWGTILYFAALTNVNPELYEAAKIDGAGPLERTMAVTIPTILPLVSFSLIMTIGNILNNDFEQILMFYNSAVYDVADIIDTWVYRVGLGKMQYSIGSAVSLMKAIVSLILIVTANAISRRTSGLGLW